VAAGFDEHLEAVGANLVDERTVEFGFEVDDAVAEDKRDRPPVVHHEDVRRLLLGIEQRDYLLGPRTRLLGASSDLDTDLLGDTGLVERLRVEVPCDGLVAQDLDIRCSAPAIAARQRGHASRPGCLDEPASREWPGRRALIVFCLFYHHECKYHMINHKYFCPQFQYHVYLYWL